MRSKEYSLLIAVVSIIYLSADGKLDLYIHPRYIVFTTVMCVIGLGVYLLRSQDTRFELPSRSYLLRSLPLIFMIGAVLLLPARTLSSSTVSQRVTDGAQLIRTSESASIDTLFAGSSKGLGIVDWTRILFANKDPQYYANKPAVVSGFVYDAELGSDTVWLARFVLTCCAVDAQPVGVPVQIQDWQGSYEQDQWLEAEGVFTLQQTEDGEQLVLTPERVDEIDEPENPYARR